MIGNLRVFHQRGHCWWFTNTANSPSWYGESTIIYRVLSISGWLAFGLHWNKLILHISLFRGLKSTESFRMWHVGPQKNTWAVITIKTLVGFLYGDEILPTWKGLFHRPLEIRIPQPFLTNQDDSWFMSPGWVYVSTFVTERINTWAMQKKWLVGLYRGLYYPTIWGL